MYRTNVTSVCTISGRLSLICWTNAAIPTAFSLWTCCSRTSSAIRVPVRPTPALVYRNGDRNTEGYENFALFFFFCQCNYLLILTLHTALSSWLTVIIHIKLIFELGFKVSGHLQCTIVGPAEKELSICWRTSPLNWINSSVPTGTPWSGHAVKWKCLTVRVSEVSFCYRQK